MLATISCRKHPHLQSTKTHSIRQYCGKQIQSHVWTIPLIMTPNFLISNPGWVTQKWCLHAYWMHFWSGGTVLLNFLNLKCSIVSICIVLKLSKRERIYRYLQLLATLDIILLGGGDTFLQWLWCNNLKYLTLKLF